MHRLAALLFAAVGVATLCGAAQRLGV
jgi:hypothetical protein